MSTGDADTLYDRLMAVRPSTLTRNAWAVQAGLSRSVFTDIKRRGSAQDETIDALLSQAGVSRAQFDAGDVRVRSEVAGHGAVGARDVRSAFYGEDAGRPLEVLGTAVGGEIADLDEAIELTELWYSQVVDHVARPAALKYDPDAYALTIVGDSMAPRYKPSERVAVSPRASVSFGDDVIVQLRGPDGEDGERVTMVLIKELVRKAPTYLELRQHNPALTFRVPTQRVAAIHKVTSNFF